jgi:membrane-bound ClpP family serine protease
LSRRTAIECRNNARTQRKIAEATPTITLLLASLACCNKHAVTTCSRGSFCKIHKLTSCQRPRLTIAPGAEGIAVATLRPSGKAQFGDRVVDVFTGGEFITAQTPVIVTEIDGMRVLVRQLWKTLHAELTG